MDQPGEALNVVAVLNAIAGGKFTERWRSRAKFPETSTRAHGQGRCTCRL